MLENIWFIAAVWMGLGAPREFDIDPNGNFGRAD